MVQLQFGSHDRRFCLGRRCLTAPVSRCRFYPQQTLFIWSLTAQEMFSSSNACTMYMMHMQGEKCFFFKSIPMLSGPFWTRSARAEASQRRPFVTRLRKRKNWNNEPRGHFITQTGRPGDPQPPGYISPRNAIRHQRVRGRKIHQNSLCSVRYTKEPLGIRDGRCVYSRLH